MTDETLILSSLGQDAPILADGRRTPDRREISLRWLSGTFLTGITSSILMGVALFAALDGRQQLATPAKASTRTDEPQQNQQSAVTLRGGRILQTVIASKPTDRKVMEVSTIVKEGEKEIIRKKPFSHVNMVLAANRTGVESYPPFDALNIFSTDSKDQPAAPQTGLIYGSEVESDVSLKVIPFPAEDKGLTYAPTMTLDEAEENVRTNGSVLTDGNSQVASLFYVDPQRFAADSSTLDITQGLTARIVEENMTVSAPQTITPESPEFADDVIPIKEDMAVSDAMVAAGYAREQGDDVGKALAALLNSDRISGGSVLRIGIMQQRDKARILRASVYDHGTHVLTVALNDRGEFVPGSEPPIMPQMSTEDDMDVMPSSDADLPRVYDGIYRAALSYGMTLDMAGRVVKLLASSIDLQAKLKPTDRLEAFFSVNDDSGKATDESELLYLNARFGDNQTRFYRFQDPDDGSVDYYDEDGKSLRQFLLRNPVPNGIFKSGFGMRVHPILGYRKMHTGVDWAAPRGTPIIAAGSGTVIKAGWDAGGYGNQTMIQHANGYVTSYNHQSAIAKGVVEGAKIKQGQVIGWIGSTGESTGPHLHYEMIVNGNKVDPLRIRLPDGRTLQGESLARFQSERKRIDALLSGKKDEIAAKS
jgi:murein DD-endopeptidase MepM/ murein hydrolase activator NlpD